MSPLAKQRERWFYSLISPWLIGFVLFQGGPIVGAFVLAFFEWPLPRPPQFVGATHFNTLLSDELFWQSLGNTAYYTLGAVPLLVLLGLGLAILLNLPWRSLFIFRTVFFLPVVVSGVAMTLLWGWLFNPRFGLINSLLAEMGIRGPGWLQDEQWAMPTLIIMAVWGVGTNMLVYLAALQSVPPELYEAAVLDGAGLGRRFRHITWPLISPVTFYLVIVNSIGALQLFTPAYILTRGGPNNATLTLPLYIYFNAFSWSKLGYASAVSLILFILIIGFTWLQFRLADRWVFYRGQ